jgi:hypothetical protein
VPEISEQFLLFLRLTILLTLLVISALMVFISVRGMRRAMREQGSGPTPAAGGEPMAAAAPLIK